MSQKINILESEKWSKNVPKIEHFKPKQVLQPGIFGYPVTKYIRLQHYEKFRSPPVHVSFFKIENFQKYLKSFIKKNVPSLKVENLQSYFHSVQLTLDSGFSYRYITIEYDFFYRGGCWRFGIEEYMYMYKLHL